jgi:hypothetical protein
MTIARKLVLGTLALTLLWAAPAQAEFGLVPGSVGLGLSTTQAGAHPDVTQSFHFNTVFIEGVRHQDGSPRNVDMELPAGLIGDTTATNLCSQAELVSNVGCTPDTQVGETTTNLLFPSGFELPLHSGVYNVKPGPGEVAAFGFRVAASFVHIGVHVRTGGDYGVTATLPDIPQTLTLIGATTTLWGVPADHLEGLGQRRPFMTNPTSCGEPLSFTVRSNSWQEPGSFVSQTGTGPAITGCDSPPFEPSVSVRPGSSKAGQPSAYGVGLALPQQGNPDGFESSTLKDATVALPDGVTISSAAADGLGACSEAQIGLESAAVPSCPESSKIGTVRIDTPLLPDLMEGDVYLAEQGDIPGGGSNPFGSMLAIYVTAAGDNVRVKLAGKIEADPETGQLTTSFLDNPQLPFSEMTVSLKGGPRAALVNPDECGTYVSHAELSGWARPIEVVPSDSSFAIDEGCGAAARFAPGFQAGGANPVAGAFSPFTLRVTREDGEANLSRIGATLPEGELAKLAGVPLCPDAQATSGACPAASQVGTATVGVGAGSNPLYLPQAGHAPTAIYLAGPYRGGPYSLVTKVPAQAGPFDLGNVTVRSAINVDPTNARVSVESDPLPQILRGVPISYRDVRVDVSRPEFTLNPTSCEPMRVEGDLASQHGQTAAVSSRFQVGDCARLGFGPKLALRLSGGTERGDHPALRATVTQRAGGANIGRVSVALPHSEFLEQSHINTICTRVQFAQHACPQGSVYGFARAITPLLDQPLEGPVYLRSSNHALPDLVAALHGPIEIDLAGRIDSVDGGIRTVFETVPDAPVSKFVLRMKGGRKGLLVNSTDICSKKRHAKVVTTGQNGKAAVSNPVLASSCGGEGGTK